MNYHPRLVALSWYSSLHCWWAEEEEEEEVGSTGLGLFHLHVQELIVPDQQGLHYDGERDDDRWMVQLVASNGQHLAVFRAFGFEVDHDAYS